MGGVYGTECFPGVDNDDLRGSGEIEGSGDVLVVSVSFLPGVFFSRSKNEMKKRMGD